MSKHTPGPWVPEQGIEDEEDRWGVFFAGPKPWHIATIQNGAPGDTLDTEEANARLIAAAPDLLAESKVLLSILRLQPTPKLGEWNWPQIADRLEAVIAKAEPDQSATTEATP